MSKPSDFFGGSINIGSNKNLIINGNFDVWQRGISQTVNGYYSTDRWRTGQITTTATLSQQAFTVGQTDVPNNPKYYARSVITAGSATDSVFDIQHRIEDVTLLAGKTVSYSFWARADSNKSMVLDFYQHFQASGVGDIEGFSTVTLPLTATWQKFTGTVTLPSASGKTVDVGSYLGLIFYMSAGTNYDSITNSLGNQSGTFDIAQVQVEFGDEVTDFEYRTLDDEFRMCQRYYQVLLSIDGVANQYHVSYTRMNTIRYPTIMRAVPSVTVSGGPAWGSGTTGTPGLFHSYYTTTDHIAPIYKWTGATGGQAIVFSSYTVLLDAEI